MKKMFDRYAIRNVKIGSFTDNKTGEHASISSDGKTRSFGYIEVNTDSIEEVLAVIDEKNNNAIDIFNGNVYHILKRDEYNRIIEKPGFVQPNELYALQVSAKNKYTDSQLFRMYCISMASKVVNDYKEKYEGDVSFQKVKKN